VRTKFFNSYGKKWGSFETIADKDYSDIFRLCKLTNETSANKLVLDAGCGSGAFGIRLSKIGFKVVGVDISRELLCTSRSAELNFHPILGDLMVMSIP